MGPWIIAHPWMTFWLGLAALSAIDHILSPASSNVTVKPLAGTPSTTTMGVLFDQAAKMAPTLPKGNGVYHGLVRI